MELLCAILTAVLFWLFIYHCFRGHRVRARRKAGQLLLRFRKQRSLTYWIWVLVLLGFFGHGVLYSVLSSTRWNSMNIDPAGAFLFFNIAMVGICHLMLGYRGLELREHGLVAPYGNPVVFAPWHYIRYCRWKPNLRKLHVQYLQGKIEYSLCRKQFDEANAILKRHVEVRSLFGTILPDDIDKNDNSTSDRREPEIRRLQFRLRTLLLLMIVLSSAFSWAGIRMRIQGEEREVLERFEKMKPRITRFGNRVHFLDFSLCKQKPTDDDLIDVGRLRQLRFLNLADAPITDAGLRHLEDAKSLRTVLLQHTQATEGGVEKLRQALPHAEIEH